MILSNPFISYAQYNEDVILLALLSDVNNGVYVDIGANYPIEDSVTKLFYKNGWSGINIEPIPYIFEMLKKDRPNDINLNIGISSKEGELDFFENKAMPGHSSFDQSKAKHFNDDKTSKYKVKIKTLKDVLKANNVKNINFLKIDVEGFEDEVVAGNDWSVYRPEVICIESSDEEASWEKTLKNNQYKFFINDGLNAYYVAEESWHRTKNFADTVVKLSHQALKKHQYDAWARGERQLKKVTRLNQTHFDLVQKLRRDNQLLIHDNELSLKGVSYIKRLKRSAYGLTVDWLRYKIGDKRG